MSFNLEKIKNIFKKIGIGFLIFVIFMAAIDVINKDDKNIEINKKTAPVVKNKEIKATDNIVKKEKNKYIGKTFTVNHKTEFEGYTTPFLPLWQSHDVMKKVGEVKRYDKVELLDYDKENFYCKVKKDDKNIGWFLCNWLEEIPDNMKLDTNF